MQHWAFPSPKCSTGSFILIEKKILIVDDTYGVNSTPIIFLIFSEMETNFLFSFSLLFAIFACQRCSNIVSNIVWYEMYWQILFWFLRLCCVLYPYCISLMCLRYRGNTSIWKRHIANTNNKSYVNQKENSFERC